ncbi:EAL domain-containing protein [Parachitinimonas caeni]|uniref:EAL domain-containing protein n=1 Tax=Parachitinimonas caeni TaxID=3031301 RepID=A0ABT7DV28_9NEIS|nr:EAL domain-containing protein [Parachitinimonas caeni]MDK2122502.1 EAL domain-containing protein [Parachitinimonas caeni]
MAVKVPFFRTLRARLVLAILLVQFVVFGVLLANVSRVWSDMELRATEVRVQELARLLNAALAPSLATLDYESATELLDSVRTPEGIDYLVLFDHQNKVAAARGWDPGATLPAVDRIADFSGSKLPPVVHAQAVIELAGQRYGVLRFGVSTELLRDSANRLVWQSATVVVLGAIISAVLLAIFGVLLTRRLYRLIGSAEVSSNADTVKMLPSSEANDDEIGQLAARFNLMAASMQERLEALRRSEEKFHAIADYTYGVELWLSPEGQLVWINASLSRLTGYSDEECHQMRDFPVPLAVLEDRVALSETIKDALSGTSGQDFEFRAVKRDGKTFWASMSWQPIYDAQGQSLGIRASIHDNTQSKEDRLALKRAVYELRQSQTLGQNYLSRAEQERARLSALLSAMRFGVLFVDPNNIVVYHNPAFIALWLIDASSEVVGKPIGQVLQSSLNLPLETDTLSQYLQEVEFQGDSRVSLGEITMNDGRIVTQQCYLVRDDQGSPSGRLWVYEDVTQEHFLNERMAFLAERDGLTGLFNRHAFNEQLQRMLVEADRGQDSLAVLYFDLDEFKYVNDTFGHGAGDDLLKRIANEVSAQVRRHEFFARLGGDEFAVLVPSCSEQEVSLLAQRIVTTVQQIQFVVDGQTLRLSSSLGVAMYPAHANSAEELVSHADTAMYQAKSAGKSTWRLYQAEQDASREMVNRLTWNERIQQALANDGFVLYFQGIYETVSRKVSHLEALIRMRDPNNSGMVLPPGLFIPHAERSGRILEIDRWVIQQVIRLLALHPEMPPIAINISGRSFDEAGLPDYIRDLLVKMQVQPSRLMVELTETAALSDMRDAQRFIDSLRATGCTVCLDDFGAGFSSFAYLKHLKAHVLKIDGLFIRDLPNDHDSQVFVKAMAAMARDMGKHTVAEFVENEETMRMLAEFGVDMVQGFHLDRPSPDHPAFRVFKGE